MNIWSNFLDKITNTSWKQFLILFALLCWLLTLAIEREAPPFSKKYLCAAISICPEEK